MREELNKIKNSGEPDSNPELAAFSSSPLGSVDLTIDIRSFERRNASAVIIEIGREVDGISSLKFMETDYYGRATGDGFEMKIPKLPDGDVAKRLEWLLANNGQFDQIHDELCRLQQSLNQVFPCKALTKDSRKIANAREESQSLGKSFVSHNQPASLELMADGVKRESMILVQQAPPSQQLMLEIRSSSVRSDYQETQATVYLGNKELRSVGRTATNAKACAALERNIQLLCNTFQSVDAATFINYVMNERGLILPFKQKYPSRRDILTDELAGSFVPVDPDSVIPVDARTQANLHHANWSVFGVKGESPCVYAAFAVGDDICQEMRLGFGEGNSLIIRPVSTSGVPVLFSPFGDCSINELIRLILNEIRKNPFDFEFPGAEYRYQKGIGPDTSDESIDFAVIKGASISYALWTHDQGSRNPIFHRDFGEMVYQGDISNMSESVPLLGWGKDQLMMRVRQDGITHFWLRTKDGVAKPRAVRRQDNFEQTRDILDSIAPLLHDLAHTDRFDRPSSLKKLDAELLKLSSWNHSLRLAIAGLWTPG